MAIVGSLRKWRQWDEEVHGSCGAGLLGVEAGSSRPSSSSSSSSSSRSSSSSSSVVVVVVRSIVVVVVVPGSGSIQ